MIGRLTAGAVAAGTTALAGRWLRAHAPGGADVWERRNHRAEPVTLLEGPAYVAGALAGTILTPGLTARTRIAALLATSAAAGLGAADDLRGDGSSRGLRGHLGALRRGEITTGSIKILGLGAAGLASAAIAGGRSAAPARAGRPGRCGLAGRAGDAALSGALVAGTANLVNLLDLRPGRALKVVATGALLTTGLSGRQPARAGSARLAASALGAALAALPDDLAERSMLGDTGANAAGALLGLAWVDGLSRRGRLLALGAVTGLTLLSERVSFSAVIDRNPALRALDRLGRRTTPPGS